MADPFDSSHRKIARAEEHFADLEREIAKFTLSQPYASVVEPHPDKPEHYVHKVKLTKPLPSPLSDITADIVGNLRNALDNAGFAVAVAAGCTHPKNAAFPFAGSVAQMANSLGRSKDLPQQIQSFFCGFQPYPGGDDLLWALNEICVTDKHKMLIPVGTGVVHQHLRVEAVGGPFSMPETPFWDGAKNEMVLCTVSSGTEKLNYNFNFNIFVAFGDIKIVSGEPVLGVLHALGRKVDSILLAIEAETRRLGFIK